MDDWRAIKVELVGGRGARLWPRPGRIFAVAREHTFVEFADQINDAFGRWDLAHLSEFTLSDGTRLGDTDPEFDPPEDMVDFADATVDRVAIGEQFAFVFDLGDDWQHLCTVLDDDFDPLELFGEKPPCPVVLFGWGDVPDQYGRRWEDDDGESSIPPDPKGSDLPAFFAWC